MLTLKALFMNSMQMYTKTLMRTESYEGISRHSDQERNNRSPIFQFAIPTLGINR